MCGASAVGEEVIEPAPLPGSSCLGTGATMTGATDGLNVGRKLSADVLPGEGVESHDNVYPSARAPTIAAICLLVEIGTMRSEL